jgi:hypothetical protein
VAVIFGFIVLSVNWQGCTIVLCVSITHSFGETVTAPHTIVAN